MNIYKPKLNLLSTADGIQQSILYCVGNSIKIDIQCKIKYFSIVPPVKYSFILGSYFFKKLQMKFNWKFLMMNLFKFGA